MVVVSCSVSLPDTAGEVIVLSSKKEVVATVRDEYRCDPKDDVMGVGHELHGCQTACTQHHLGQWQRHCMGKETDGIDVRLTKGLPAHLSSDIPGLG